ncbi:TraR/DksA family transcriptional regulator [Actinocorallia aurantiaca]
MAGTASVAQEAQKAEKLPVREGEERWTAEELEAVRTRLAAEVEELAAEISAALTQAAEGTDLGEGAGDDQADAGAKTYEREHELALTNNSRDLLQQNERAIARIETGTYGVCEECGKAIGKARLQAFPRATLCVTCKQREERR